MPNTVGEKTQEPALEVNSGRSCVVNFDNRRANTVLLQHAGSSICVRLLFKRSDHTSLVVDLHAVPLEKASTLLFPSS